MYAMDAMDAMDTNEPFDIPPSPISISSDDSLEVIVQERPAVVALSTTYTRRTVTTRGTQTDAQVIRPAPMFPANSYRLEGLPSPAPAVFHRRLRPSVSMPRPFSNPNPMPQLNGEGPAHRPYEGLMGPPLAPRQVHHQELRNGEVANGYDVEPMVHIYYNGHCSCLCPYSYR